MKILKCFVAGVSALTVFALSGALWASGISEYTAAFEKEQAPRVGQEYYLRNCIWYENGTHDTTNYTRGALLPINTKVTLVSLGSDGMSIRVDTTGEQVQIKNTGKYTRKSMVTIARNMLSPSEVSLEGFPREIADAIRSGEMRLGMTKQQVIMARGWPPAHKTPSLDQNTWMYWSSRFIIHSIAFKDGKLVEGRGLH
jgi:hypothetical protein